MKSNPTYLPLVVVLCSARSTVYNSIPGVETFGRAKSAWSCQLRRPIIAHPPCRFWSRWHCRASATVPTMAAEMLLGMECVRLVRKNGGVLEQPAFSRLWQCAHLPGPCTWPDSRNEWSIELDQAEFGHHTTKRTWLFFSGIAPGAIDWQGWSLANPRRRTLQVMTPGQRSATPARFAHFLFNVALNCKPSRP
jgi:hypothetical protein